MTEFCDRSTHSPHTHPRSTHSATHTESSASRSLLRSSAAAPPPDLSLSHHTIRRMHSLHDPRVCTPNQPFRTKLGHHSRASLACHRATRSLPPDSIDLSPTSRPHNFAALRVPRPYRGGPVRHLAQGVPVSLTSPLARRAIHAGHVQAKCRRRLRACRCSPRTSMRQRVEVEARKLRVI